MSVKANSQFERSVMVDGIKVDICSCWDSETPDNEIDFYDLFVGGECINLGELLYDFPDEQTIRTFLDGHTNK